LAERVSQLERGIAPSATQTPVKTQQPSQVSKPIPKPAPPPESAPAPAQSEKPVAIAEEIETPPAVEALPAAQETPPAQAEEPVAIPEERETAEPEEVPAPAAQPIIQSVTVAEAPQAEVTASDSESISLSELDRIWSDMLDQLQRKHIPTFSVASMHAFPISLAQTELVIGVPNETLQRTLEGKASHIKNVTAQVIGREVHVKFRVVAREVAPVPAKKPSRPVETPVSQAAAGDDDDYRDDEPSQPAAPMMAQSSLPVEPVANDGTIIKEAYRLFEGPGSRRLGAD